MTRGFRERGLAGARLAALLALAAAASGCLQRRIRVLTDPPGATVWLNDQQIGESPAEAAFRFFGTYDVRVEKEGYRTLNTTRKAVAPWYEYPFIDLFVIALPFTVETKVQWTLRLEPLEGAEGGAGLLERAGQMRREVGADPAPKAENGGRR